MTEQTILSLLDDLVLQRGSHESRKQGMCIMEAVAFVAGEPHSDSPACACPTVAGFMRAWNDAIPDDGRRTALLRPLVPRLVGSLSTFVVAERRSWLCFDWIVRVQAPTWMDLSPSLATHAASLRALEAQISRERRDDAEVTLAAAGDAARAAAWAAAGAAAWDAAGAAARAAAWGRLAPTVAALQASALVLVDRMLTITPETTVEQFDALCVWPALQVVAS